MNSRLKQELLITLEACESKKAEDVTILEMDKASGAFTDFFILCTGNSDRQNQTIADEIELQIKSQLGGYAHQVEGYSEGEWVLVDYTDFVVHIFTAERRAFYGLERLWKSARTLKPAELRSMAADSLEPEQAAPALKAPAKKSRSIKALSTRTTAKAASKKATKAAATKEKATSKKATKATPAKKKATSKKATKRAARKPS